MDTLRALGQQETNMSLDNTSRPGRPGLDELVPSRYALRVGEIDVMVVSDGVLSLPGAMLGHNADPAVRAAWRRRPHPRAQRGPPGVRRRRLTFALVGSWRRTASRWWPLTCRFRPSAMWRSTVTSFVGYRPSGSTDRLLGWGRTRRPHAFEQPVDRCVVRHGPYLRRLRLRLLNREQVDHRAIPCRTC
jgi:hypothetical protein